MKRFLTLLTCILLTAPLAAHAYEPDESMLKDYIGLTKSLRANGIEPINVQWVQIEPMCLGLKTEKDQVPYNRCRFEKASDWAAYGDNRRDCDEGSLLEYPQPQRFTQATVTNADGSVASVTTAEGQYLSAAQIKRLRRASYVACMRDFGWKNPSNWQHGRDEN